MKTPIVKRSDRNVSRLVTRSELDTESVAAQLAKRLRYGMVVGLHGEIGAGKTVFARGVAKGLGIAAAITSPTFTIIQAYPLKPGWFYHIDLYRMAGEDDAIAAGLEDFLNARDAITVVEWAERIDSLLDEDSISVAITVGGRDNREIVIHFPR